MHVLTVLCQSILEPQFQSSDGPWIFSTQTPSLADVALYYQLDWAFEIAAGRGINNLTGGATEDTDTEGASAVFNPSRYPAVYRWFADMKGYVEGLPLTETKTTDAREPLQRIKAYTPPPSTSRLVPTPTAAHTELDGRIGLVPGTKVSVVPEDTGRAE